MILTWGASGGSPGPRRWPEVSDQQGAPRLSAGRVSVAPFKLQVSVEEEEGEDEDACDSSGVFLFARFDLVEGAHQRNASGLKPRLTDG